MEQLKPWPKGHIACICCRVGDPHWNGMPNSAERNCFNCNEVIKVSPATLTRYEADPTCTLVCVPCAAAYSEASGQKYHITPNNKAQAIERGQGDKVMSREHFVEFYVMEAVNMRGLQDTPQLRELAGRVYEASFEKNT